jgi:hypothetical protein
MALNVDQCMSFPASKEPSNYYKTRSTSIDLSTWEGDGDSSSESTRSQGAMAQSVSNARGRSPAARATRALAVQDDDDDDHEDVFYPSSDQAEMPSTREPSPEPMWNKPNPQYGCEYMPHYNQVQQVFLVPNKQVQEVKPVAMMLPQFVPIAGYPEQHRLSFSSQPGDAYLMPTSMAPQPKQASLASNAKPEPKTGSSKQREPKATSKQQEDVRSKAVSKGKGQGSKKANGKNRDKQPGDTFSNLSEEKKQALAKYIYDLMVENGFTSPDGYLLVDVLTEVWKDMGDGASGGRIAQHRFAELLRVAPQYFELFRKGIRVTNHCGWFARKGEKMVRLVPQTSQ